MTPPSRWLLLLLLVPSAALAQDRLVFSTPARPLPWARGGAPLTVQRQSGTGAPLSPGNSLAVTLSSSSPGGQFAVGGPEYWRTWSSTLTVSIPGGGSTSEWFYYRDSQTGTPTLTASATHFAPGTQIQSVSWLGASADHESGVLLFGATSGGAYDYVYEVNGIAASQAAAHRGSRGLRVADTDVSMGAGTQGDADVRTPPIQGALYARAWVRVTARNTDGNGIGLVYIFTTAATKAHILEVSLRMPDRRLMLQGYDRNGAFLGDPISTRTLADGAWVLMEWMVTGVGTADTTRALYVDGEQVSLSTGIDTTGLSIVELKVGEPWADRPFSGDIDFDDVRVASVPHASRLSLSVPASAQVGACVPVTVSLRDSVSSALARAPHALEVQLLAESGSGSFHATEGCAGPISETAFAAEAEQAVVYFKPAVEGSLTLGARDPDFLEGSTTLLISAAAPGAADAGTGQLPEGASSHSFYSRHDFGCGVAGAGGTAAGPLLWTAALTVLGAASRRSRRRGAGEALSPGP